MTKEELKQIRLYRQHLTDPTDKITAAKELCGVQCQFMSNAYHALLIRCRDALDLSDWGTGFVKNWTLRGTVHVFPEEDLPLFKYDVGSYKSASWETSTCGGAVWITAERKAFFADLIVSLVAGGICLRESLRSECRRAGMTEVEESYVFNGWGGLFRPLCERGLLNYKAQEKKAFEKSPEYAPMSENDAKREMMRRYLTHIAPATVRDISYFFGFPQKEVKAILGCLPVNCFDFGGVDCFYMGELQNDYPDIPHCVFLAGFDQLMLGYQKTESVFLPPEYLRGIFNLAGIVMPSILIDGTVAGKWRRKGKKLEVTCFRSFTKKEKKQTESRAAKLWGNDINITYIN